MKASSTLALLGLVSAAVAAPVEIEKRATVQGFDVSDYQTSVDFAAAYKAGARFVIIKATESTDYISPQYSSQWSESGKAGLIHGAYHFAHPNEGSGAAQAEYFVKHGGHWTKDGKTLPGMLDIEYNPSGSTCYGLSQSAMTAWVKSFVDEYHKLTSRYPMIYSTANWWEECTGNAKDFHTESPLVLADYNSSPGTIPGGWSFQTIWQNNDHYKYGGDSDVFNGSLDNLKKLASG